MRESTANPNRTILSEERGKRTSQRGDAMNGSSYFPAVGMRIDPHVLEHVCKRMIRVILYALPHATRGTIYSVGPIPELRVVRVASGPRDGQRRDLVWDVTARSDYDTPGKVWEEYRDRAGGVLEAMAWCVERQKSWTADDPEHDTRSARKQLEGKAAQDYHHMEPVLVAKTDLWDHLPALSDYPKHSSGNPVWRESEYATVAVIKIDFLPGSMSGGDTSTRIIKELSHALGTQMLSLHARELALDKEKRLTEERQEVCNTLAHEFRNLVSRLGFAYRAINNEIAYLRESWENLIHQHFPDQPDRRTILRKLIEALSFIKAKDKDAGVENEISELGRLQEKMMRACLLPSQNEMWFQDKIQPLWTSIFSKTDLRAPGRAEIEDLLDSLRKSFHVGTDEALREGLRGLPDQLKRQWVDLVYRQVNGGDDGYITRYISLLEAIPFDLPRKTYSLNNLLSLKPLVEVLPEIEQAVNHSLAQLKNSW